jgi:hypothetical protein
MTIANLKKPAFNYLSILIFFTFIIGCKNNNANLCLLNKEIILSDSVKIFLQDSIYIQKLNSHMPFELEKSDCIFILSSSKIMVAKKEYNYRYDANSMTFIDLDAIYEYAKSEIGDTLILSKKVRKIGEIRMKFLKKK